MVEGARVPGHRDAGPPEDEEPGTRQRRPGSEAARRKDIRAGSRCAAEGQRERAGLRASDAGKRRGQGGQVLDRLETLRTDACGRYWK